MPNAIFVLGIVSFGALIDWLGRDYDYFFPFCYFVLSFSQLRCCLVA